MDNKYKFLNWISREFEIEKVCYIKPTARGPYSLRVKQGKQKYLIVFGQSEIQKFYIDRSIRMQKIFWDDYKEFFDFNFPIRSGEYLGIKYAIYDYYDDLVPFKGEKGLAILESIYSKKAEIVEATDEIIEIIITNMLMAWPDSFHHEIKQLKSYSKYINFLKSRTSIRICKEHGDYNAENVVRKGTKLYLMDFEFAKEKQPIGLDRLDFLDSTGGFGQDNLEGKLKQELCDDINKLVDGKKNYFHIRLVEQRCLKIWKILLDIRSMFQKRVKK